MKPSIPYAGMMPSKRYGTPAASISRPSWATVAASSSSLAGKPTASRGSSGSACRLSHAGAARSPPRMIATAGRQAGCSQFSVPCTSQRVAPVHRSSSGARLIAGLRSRAPSPAIDRSAMREFRGQVDGRRIRRRVAAAPPVLGGSPAAPQECRRGRVAEVVCIGLDSSVRRLHAASVCARFAVFPRGPGLFF